MCVDPSFRLFRQLLLLDDFILPYFCRVVNMFFEIHPTFVGLHCFTDVFLLKINKTRLSTLLIN